MRLILLLLLSACSTTQPVQSYAEQIQVPPHPIRMRIQPLLDDALLVGGNLSDEIQARLDVLADPFSENQEITRYWIDTMPGQKIVYVETLEHNILIFTLTMDDQ